MPAVSRPPAKNDHVFLVDGSSYIFRAYHALPPLSRKSDGLQLNAVYGFCNMLWKLLRDMKPEDRPTHLAIVFDKSEKTFRNELYPAYKAHRPDAPADLIPQFALIREAVHAFDLPCLEQSGFEADDLIATYVRQACEVGASATIVSSDKDLMQLINDCVTMYDTMKDRRIGPAEVMEKFGVPPDKVIEVQSLIGDSTDNVPGVPGIGVKTAAQLIGEFGDLETLLARAGEIKQQKRRESLIENADKARLSKTLVTLDAHVALAVPLADIAVHDPDAKRLIAFLKAMEFNTLIRRVAEFSGADAAEIEPDPRLRAAIAGPHAERRLDEPGLDPADLATVATPLSPEQDGTSAAARPAAGNGPAAMTGLRGTQAGWRRNAAPVPPQTLAPQTLAPQALAAERIAAAKAAKVDRSRYEAVLTMERLRAYMARAHEAGVVAIAVAGTGTDPMQAELCGFALAVGANEACYVPLSHRQGGDGTELFAGEIVPDQIDAIAALDAVKTLLEDAAVLKVGHNLKFAWQVLAHHGIDMAPHDDVMLMSYVLDAGRFAHGTDAMAEHWLDHRTINYGEVAGTGKAQLCFNRVMIDKATAYAAEQADVMLRLWQLLRPRLVAEGMLTVYETLERALVPVLARMERRGIAIDRAVLSRLSGDFAQTAAAVEEETKALAGEPLNPGSPKQLGDILFGKMNLSGGRKTKTGAWSTSASVLEDLAAEGHALPQRILEWRQVTKLKSTYTDALPGFVHPRTRRVHTCYALAATTTGRLSSSDPNLQNIPIRSEEGRKIRRAFVAEPGHKLISADYSQIELRLLAEIADITPLRQAFRDGLDIHAMTASEMFGVPVEKMPGEVRRRAKAINFGIIYGISAFGLANQLGIPRDEAAAYIKKYFERFPGIKLYMEATRDACRKHGYVTTLFGRKCHYPDIAAANPSIRAFNERAAINARLQGTAADIIRRAMIRMDEALARDGLAARMLLQVHDELVFEVPDGEIARTLPVIKRVMEEAPHPAVTLAVPLKVDARAADNWEEAH
jgi:DNA polymerase I